MKKQDGQNVKKQAIIPHSPQPPDLADITPIDKVAGRNRPALNLRDHPELDGMNVIIVDARLSEGSDDYGGKPYAIMQAWVFTGPRPDPNDLFTLITGSDNVFERISLVLSEDAFPVSGKLRKSGRAWFLD